MSLISQRARDFVRTRATEVMDYSCRAERVSHGGYDETTLHSTSATRTTLYEGPCRLFEVAGAVALNLGDTEMEIQSTQISLPWDSPLLKKDDEIVLTATPTDVGMVGKRFQVQSSAKAGELRATRRYAVTSMG